MLHSRENSVAQLRELYIQTLIEKRNTNESQTQGADTLTVR
jgi:hypothetical protein